MNEAKLAGQLMFASVNIDVDICTHRYRYRYRCPYTRHTDQPMQLSRRMGGGRYGRSTHLYEAEHEFDAKHEARSGAILLRVHPIELKHELTRMRVDHCRTASGR
jgi:hypothetical protein